MNFRFTAILFTAVVLGISVLALVTYFDSDKVDTDGLVAPFTKTGLKESDVDTVEIARSEPAEERLVFSKIGDGKWELKQPVVAKIDSFAVESIIKMLFNVKAARYPGLTDNLAQHGLAKPTIRITLKRGADTSATVNIGDTTIGGSDAFSFVTTGENPDRPIALRALDLRPLFREAAAGKDGAAWTLSKWLTDFRARRLLGAEVTNPDTGIDSVSLKRGTATLKLSRSGDGVWKFDEPADYGEADTAGDTVPRSDIMTGVRPLLNSLITLQPGGVGDYIEGVTNADWAKYGLAESDPGVIRVELKPKGAAAPEVLLIGKKVEKDGKPAVPTKVYCRMLGDSAAILVPGDRIDALAATIANPSEMRNKDLVAEGKKDLIDAIDISQGAATFKLRRISTAGGGAPQWAIYGQTPDGRWATFAGASDPGDARASVGKLIDALTKPRAAKAVLSAASPDLFAETKATVKLWYSGQPANTPIAGDAVPAEPAMKGEPAIVLTLGKIDADVAYLKRTAAGRVVDFQMPLDFVASILRPRMDYVDPKIGSFQLLNVTKLAFNRGAEAIEINRIVPTERVPGALIRWEFAKPDARKGKSADGDIVAQMLQSLAAQQTAKLISDAPTPDELTRWGLTAPRMKAAVSQDKQPDRVYEFGTETDDKKAVYFRVADKPFVFTAPKDLFDQYAAADLRDRVLFRVDASKVQRLEITAWKNSTLDGKPFVLKLEKRGNAWVATEPKDFPLDPSKLAGLLMVLEAPRTSEYVPGLTAEMGLDVQDGAFQVLIVPETGPAQLLRIGKEDATKRYLYALGSNFEGVVRIDSFLFKPYVDQPASLRK